MDQPTFLDVLAVIVAGLRRAVSAEAVRDGRAGVLIGLLWDRLNRVATEFSALAAKLAENTLPPILCRGPRTKPRRAPTPADPPPVWLPRHRGWLVQIAPETSQYIGQVTAWMARPEVQALLAASPRFRAVLSPLCRMLGIEQALPERPKPPRQPKVRPAEPPPPKPRKPKGRPLYGLPRSQPKLRSSPAWKDLVARKPEPPSWPAVPPPRKASPLWLRLAEAARIWDAARAARAALSEKPA